MGWIVGCDVGGTFTDFYTYEDESGTSFVHKTPSTPDNPARAIVEGLRELCQNRSIAPASIRRIDHGTTVATNCLIQRRGGKVALITTRGFRDLLEIGRQIRPHMYDMQIDQPDPLVPREWRIEANERVLSDGTVQQALGDQEVDRLVAAVKASEVDACVVCFLFSYLNPAHEKRVGAALVKALPNLHVSLSCEVHPEFREYERLSTTVLNAYLQPVLVNYLDTLQREVARDFSHATLGINQSSGGLMSVERARRFPVRTALSGPAAGVVGAIHVARLAKRPNFITFDMGGTSTDVCLVRDFGVPTSFDRNVADFPVRLPMVDINTIGAGGGSIAWFDRDGLLKVGPISAGAVPGPACYGMGGERPAVTDANLVLGRLGSGGLIGGRLPLDVAAARKSLAAHADRLGYSIEKTAHGMLGIVVSNMVRAIRAVSVERGHDPRQFTLMPFGGAGPLHATEVARSLGIREILVPPAPGILCAQGLVVSDLKENFVRTRRTLVEETSGAAIGKVLDELMDEARAWCGVEGITPENQRFSVLLDMRYIGQNFELSVPLDEPGAGGAITAPRFEALRASFFAAHEKNYGYFNPSDPFEIVNYRLVAHGLIKPPARPRGEAAASAVATPVGRRDVYFVADASESTPIFDRATLSPGLRIHGPAVIDQLDATTVLYPGDTLAVDEAFNLVIEVNP